MFWTILEYYRSNALEQLKCQLEQIFRIEKTYRNKLEKKNSGADAGWYKILEDLSWSKLWVLFYFEEIKK